MIIVNMIKTTGSLLQFGKPGAPPKWNSLLTFGLICILTLTVKQVNCANESNEDFEEKSDDAPVADAGGSGGSSSEIVSNRVLPVDADHKNKLGTPLEAICVQTIRDNLVKFLKRHARREGRQDEDGSGEEGIAGVIGNIAEGNGALSTLQALPSVFPQLVSTLTMLSGAVNMGLNGTDTPNLPSFLAKHGGEAIKFFQAIASGASQSSSSSAGPKLPSEVHVQRIPGTNPGPPVRVHAGPPSSNGGRVPVYEPYPGQGAVGVVPGSLGAVPIDPDDYLDEDVKQPLQPTLAPLVRPGQFGYDPYGNPFIQNGNRQTVENGGGDPNAEGLPQGTSLWNIYKSFRTRPEGVNGTLSDFQLAHPEAFSNELLQSISSAISSIRGHMNRHQQQQQQYSQSAPTEKPPSEVFKQFYPAKNNSQPPPPPSIFQLGNRPTLSVYKPKDTISGVGIDLSNLALNATHTILAGKGPGSNVGKEDEDDPSSAEETTPQPQEELEAPPVGLQKPVKAGSTVIGTGTLEKLQAQNSKHKTPRPGGPHFVKSPTSSHLALQMGEYIPSVVNVHEGEEALKHVGPQTNMEDTKNGFGNKSPYTPVLNGILLEAPRLTPSPIYENLKRPSNLMINAEREAVTEDPKNATPFPEFHFQVDKSRPDLPPNFHGPDPTTRRSTSLVAAIPNKFDYDRGQRPINFGSGLVPQSLFAKPTNAVPESDVEKATEEQAAEEAEPEKDIEGAAASATSSPLPPSPPPPTPPQQSVAMANANKLLQQLLFLQAVLQRQQQLKQQQNLEMVQSAVQTVFQDPTTPEPTTIAPPPPPQPQQASQEAEPQNEVTSSDSSTPQTATYPTKSYQTAPGYLIPGLSGGVSTPTKTASSSIASGLASALANNLRPGAALLLPNQALLNNRPPPLAASTGQKGPSVTGLDSTARNDTAEMSKVVPLRTTTKAPAAVTTQPAAVVQVPTTKVPSDIRFQQFPNFAAGPSSYFPQAAGPAPPLAPEKATETAPSTSQASTGGKIPVTTAAPISTAFSPYLPFGSFPNHLQSPVQFPPSAAAAAVSSSAQQNEPASIAATTQSPPPPSTTRTTALKTEAPTTVRTTSTDLPPLSFINFAIPSGGYFPAAVPEVPVAPPALPPPSPSFIKSQSNDPYSILTNPQFQLPAQSGGYPQYVPTNPVVLVTSTGLKTPTQSVSTAPSLPSPVNTVSQVQSVNQSVSTASPPSIISGVGSATTSFGQALASSQQQPQKMSSAIAEMSRLPFYQEDTFRPSAIPPYIIAGGSSSSTSPSTSPENAEEGSSFEEQALESVATDKPFKELFSSSANVSVDTSPTTSTSAPPAGSVPLLSEAEENDSAEEQPYPNFPPGKPVYWMNMYYPNGVPVLMKVTSTTPKPTSPRPRKRRTRSTTTALPTTTQTPEPEYYEEEEEDDLGQKKARKKKRRSTTTEAADFLN